MRQIAKISFLKFPKFRFLYFLWTTSINWKTVLHEPPGVRSKTKTAIKNRKAGLQCSEFWPNVRTFGWTFEIPAEPLKFRPNVRNSCGTLEIPAERSKFLPNVRNSCRRFGVMNMNKWSLGCKDGLPSSFVETKIIFGIWIHRSLEVVKNYLFVKQSND